MKKLCVISDHASPLAAVGGTDAGGQNVYVMQLSRWLASAGHQVDVYTRRDSPSLAERVPWGQGITVVNVPAGPAAPLPKERMLPVIPAFATYVTRCCATSKYDLVHAHFFMSALAAIKAKRLLSIPFVVTFHALGQAREADGANRDLFPAARIDIEREAVAEADRIIAESPQELDDLCRHYRADPARITVIPAGFDPCECDPLSKGLARHRLGLGQGGPVLLVLSRLVPRKGVDTVIRAIARLSSRHRIDARLLIVGGSSRFPNDGTTPEIDRLRSVASDVGVSQQVTFVGCRARAEIATYYNAADVFVTVPWYEPFGITPVEAMACGTPVVASAVGGIPSTVLDGETGLLVPPRDEDALAAAIAQLLADPGRLRAMGEHARRRADALFRWERVARLVDQAYDLVLGKVGA